ncbi:hypothetical protein FSP39_005199 [Pinctada imbricata]|uniref:Uncharacterized protein n=1 Tax=Pinctada imbricata TaxID=66713 RepID=A0AA88XKD0_PINIB|nr:hypothetical protein FSP39_005199 [Pinctada imbricata]
MATCRDKAVLITIIVALFLVYLAVFSPPNKQNDLKFEPAVWGPAADKEQPLEEEANAPQYIDDAGIKEIGFPDTWSGDRSWFDVLSGRENLTIVTAYWDLGSFKKGSSQTFTKNTYVNWMKSFAHMTSPLVVYTDSQQFIDVTKTHRKRFSSKTRIFFVDRKYLWPFKLIDQIQSVFSQPGYPKHYPNTVIPGYSAAQHSKYVVLAHAAIKRYFNTPYYAWLDVGYFRDIVHNEKFFTMNPPADFDPSRIAFNRVFDLKMNTIPNNIFKGNQVWVGGGLALGIPEVIFRFEDMYHKAVLYFLKEHLMSTDQQILFSLYSETGRKALHPPVELQLYVPKGSGNPWFYLGYLCLKTLNQSDVPKR